MINPVTFVDSLNCILRFSRISIRRKKVLRNKIKKFEKKHSDSSSIPINASREYARICIADYVDELLVLSNKKNITLTEHEAEKLFSVWNI